MGIPSFFKQYGAREFNFIPRYYDSDRERREERLRRIKQEMGIKDDGEDYVPRIQKGRMSNYFRQKKKRVQRYTAIRLIVIVMVLFIISYFFFYI